MNEGKRPEPKDVFRLGVELQLRKTCVVLLLGHTLLLAKFDWSNLRDLCLLEVGGDYISA